MLGGLVRHALRYCVIGALFAVAIAGFTSLVVTPAYAEERQSCKAADNLDEVADDFIARCRKAGIRNRLPGECLQRTLGEIRDDPVLHRKCWKLLSANKWDKDTLAPQVTPEYQEAYIVSGGYASWTVTVERDPLYEEVLVFDFGDGEPPATAVVPQGTGSISLTFEHHYDDPMVYPECSPEACLWDGKAYLDGGFLDGIELPDGPLFVFRVHVC